MSWQAPPPHWQPPPPPPRPPGGGGPAQGGQQQQQQPGGPQAPPRDLNYYELLQVDRDSHPTIIRYAYRFLAAMYHPDNAETGDAEKFRIITDAWRTLSDDGRRAAYDMSLGERQASGGGAAQQQQRPKSEFGREGLPNIPKTGISWNEIELRLAVLQILLQARKRKPQTGGSSAKMMMDILNINDMAEMEFTLWYLREKGLIEMGERLFMISVKGVDYLVDQLSKTQVLDGGSETEKTVNRKMSQAEGGAGLPARLPPTMPGGGMPPQQGMPPGGMPPGGMPPRR